MAGDGTTFEIDIAVSGAGAADSAAASCARMAVSLTDAGKASEAAAAAVKASELAYRQAESGADRAAKAVERLGLQADAQRGKLQAAMAAKDDGAAERAANKLANLVQRQSEAAARAAEASAKLSAEAAALDATRAAADGAAQAHANMTKTIATIKDQAAATAKAQQDLARAENQQAQAAAKAAAEQAKGARAQADAMAKSQQAAKAAELGSGKANEAAEAFGKLGGPLGAMGAKAFGAADAMKKLGGSLGSAGPYAAIAIAIAAIVTGVIALGVAAVAATAKIGAWAVSLADGARTQSLLVQGIAKSVKGGEELEAQLADIAAKVPVTNDELLAMAKRFSDAGLKGAELSAAIEDAATEAARLKFGPDFQKQLLSIDSQTARLKRNIGGVFGGLKIDPLLKAMSSLVALIDANSASGRAIKVVFESLFQPLIDGVTAFVPKMEKAFIEFEILVLKALIAIKPWGSKILLVAEAFGVLIAVMGVLTVGFAVAVIAPLAIAAGLVAAFVGVAIAMANVLGQIGTAAYTLGASIVGGIGAAFAWLFERFNAVVTYLTGFSLVEIGTAMINGLISGITGAAGGILSAMTGAVQGAVDGAKSLLGIASPSKVFAEIGTNTAAGMSQGVDAGAADVQGSMEALVAPPGTPGGAPAPAAGASPEPVAAAAPAAATSGGGGSKGGGGGNFAGATFNINGMKDAEAVRDVILAIIEGDFAAAGLAVPNA